MKKSLIAVAVAAALPAFAQAQTNVTMYGIVDASANIIDLGANSRNAFMVESGAMSVSRWGVRGSEDLGNGLKAVFQLEAGIFNDTGATDAAGFFQRTAQVGLSGGFGTVKLGRGYTPAFRMVGTWDALNYGLFGNMLTATIPQSVGGADIAQTRFSNAVYYDSPSFGGVYVNAAYASGETTPSALPRSAGEGWDIAVGYKGGPINLGTYYEQTKDTSAAANKTRRIGVGGGYQFGAFKVVAGYGESKVDSFKKYTAWNVGGIMNIGAGSLHAQFIGLENKNISDDEATAFGIAYVHPLSKRTSLYAQAGTTRNKSAGNFAIRTSEVSYMPDALGSDPKGFGVGIRHIF